ncbi:ATP-binding protein [Archangium sp.]|uniref:ATP-binding protein n=1 Tax=Archangium sp. TaxID=1872627 RepID=UPI00389B289E
MASPDNPSTAPMFEAGDFNLQPDPRILPMLGEINLAQWKCIAELVDNSIDAFLDARSAGNEVESPEVLVQIPMRDMQNGQVSVTDNGPGMTPELLERAVRAGWSGNEPLGKLGMFGMGFNIATARLGSVTTVWTTRAGDREWIGLVIDFEQLRKQRHFRTPRLTRPKNDPRQHGTEILIQNLKLEQRQWFARAANRTKLTGELSKAYSAMLRPGGVPIQFQLSVNGTAAPGRRHCVWGGPGNQPRVVQTPKGPVDAFQHIDLEMEPRPFCTSCWQWLASDEKSCPACGTDKSVTPRRRSIRGWLGIQRYLHENEFGIDFLRHGRKIESANKELFVWQGLDGELNETEYPIDDPRGRGRIVGEIHLDHCRVHYTKDRFDRNDPAWEDMRGLLRGTGPLRPDKASDLGLAGNTSPLYKLYQVFRRSSPKPKVAGAYKKLLVVPDNEMAKELATKFHQGLPGFETDDKWWDLIEEADRAALMGTSGGAPVRPPASGPSSAPTLPGFGTPPSTPSTTTPVVVPTPQYSVLPVASLSRTYQSQATSQKWPIQAFQVDQQHPALAGKRPWALQVLPNGNQEFFFDMKHPVFESATMTPLDALLAELAWSAMDFLRNQTTEYSFAEILADLRQRYSRASALDSMTLGNEARQTLAAIASTLREHVSPTDAPELFKELPLDDQKSILTKMATRAAGSPQALIGAARFLEYAPPHVIADFFSRHPELFLDGNCWDDEYATLNYEDTTATQLARTQVVRRYESLLSDAVWLAEQDPADLTQVPRPRLLRAMYALELLDPVSEEDGR